MGQCLCLKLYNWENHKENWIETGRKLMGFCSSHQDWWPWLGLSPKLQSVSPVFLFLYFSQQFCWEERKTFPWYCNQTSCKI